MKEKIIKVYIKSDQEKKKLNQKVLRDRSKQIVIAQI